MHLLQEEAEAALRVEHILTIPQRQKFAKMRGGEDWASGLMEGVEAVEQGFRARIQVPSSLYAN